MLYSYKTENTCSTRIEMEINGGVVSDIRFTGGCNGNLKAIPILVNGMRAEPIAEKRSGSFAKARTGRGITESISHAKTARKGSRRFCNSPKGGSDKMLFL